MINDMTLRRFAAELASRPLAMSAEAAAVAIMSLMSARPSAVDAGLADAVGDRALARSYLFSAPAPASGVAKPVPQRNQFSAAAPAVRTAAVAAPFEPPSNQGANPMSATAGLEFPALPPGHFYSADAVLKAAKREQRRAAANAIVARQLGGHSTEESWIEAALASVNRRAAGGFAPAPGAAKPAAKAADDGWTEALAKTRAASPILECYR